MYTAIKKLKIYNLIALEKSRLLIVVLLLW